VSFFLGRCHREMGMDEDQRFQLTNWRVVLKAGSFFLL